MTNAVVFEAHRDGYSIGQVAGKAMTVGELKALLGNFEDDDLFILSHDRGYTYGSICAWEMTDYESNDDGEWEEIN